MMNDSLLDKIGVTIEKMNYLYANMLKNRKNSRRLEFKLLKQYACELYEEVLNLEVSGSQLVETVPEENLVHDQPKKLLPQSVPIITSPPKTQIEREEEPTGTIAPENKTDVIEDVTEILINSTSKAYLLPAPPPSTNHISTKKKEGAKSNHDSIPIPKEAVTFPELDTDILEGDELTDDSDSEETFSDSQKVMAEQDQTTILPNTVDTLPPIPELPITEEEIKMDTPDLEPVKDISPASELPPLLEDDMKTMVLTNRGVSTSLPASEQPPISEDDMKTIAMTNRDLPNKIRADKYKSKTKTKILDLSDFKSTLQKEETETAKKETAKTEVAETETTETKTTDTVKDNAETNEVENSEEKTVAMDMNSILAKHVRSTGSSVADRLQRTVGRKDGGFDINFNQKHAFIRQLFHKDERAFYMALNGLGDSEGYIEALTYVNLNLRHDYNWKEGDPVVKDFLEVIKRRFLS